MSLTNKQLDNLNVVGKTGVSQKKFAQLNKAQKKAALTRGGISYAKSPAAKKSAKKSAKKRSRCPKGSRKHKGKCVSNFQLNKMRLQKAMARDAKRKSRRSGSKRARSTCPKNHGNSAACKAQSNCRWSPKHSKCYKKGKKRSYKPTGKPRGRPRTRSSPRVKNPGSKPRSGCPKYQLADACRMDSGCRWSPKKSRCYKKAKKRSYKPTGKPRGRPRKAKKLSSAQMARLLAGKRRVVRRAGKKRSVKSVGGSWFF